MLVGSVIGLALPMFVVVALYLVVDLAADLVVRRIDPRLAAGAGP